MKSKTKKRSPLKEKPLRHAGQSLDEQIEHYGNKGIHTCTALEFLSDNQLWIYGPLKSNKNSTAKGSRTSVP